MFKNNVSIIKQLQYTEKEQHQLKERLPKDTSEYQGAPIVSDDDDIYSIPNQQAHFYFTLLLTKKKTLVLLLNVSDNDDQDQIITTHSRFSINLSRSSKRTTRN